MKTTGLIANTRVEKIDGLGGRYPSKSQCLKVLSRVYPGAHFTGRTVRGVVTLELRYRPPNQREVVTIGSVDLPIGGVRAALPFALARAAFARYGYIATWHPWRGVGGAGDWSFQPIPGYEGPEKALPVELDPDQPAPSELDLTTPIVMSMDPID